MTNKFLCDFAIDLKSFKNLGKIFKKFKSDHFLKLNEFEKINFISEILYNLIKKEKQPCFLLKAVLDFISKIKEKKIVHDYGLSHFELWLNQYSHLKFKENYLTRAKIAGKYIPRDEYQRFFPIGMGKIFDGSHFVTAHQSPDLDTTIASFWGWLDSFAARVGKNLHFWNVPGGIPTTFIETNLLFKNIFTDAIFDLPKTRTALTLTSKDILTQKTLLKKKTSAHTIDIESGQRQKAVVIVDDNGYYLGDWRSYDVEGVRQIIMLLNNTLRWFENNIHISLISLFSQKNLKVEDIPKFIKEVFDVKIKDCDPVHEYSEKQKRYLNDYLEKVIGVKRGINATFEEFAQTLYEQKVIELHDFHKIFSVFKKSGIFDRKGKLFEDRPKIFKYLEKIILGLNLAFQSIRSYVEKLDIALKIKKSVFGYYPHFISLKSDIEEIKMKLGSRNYLTVNIPCHGKYVPVGIVRAQDLRERFLGTVSLRDFGNFEEIKLSSYFQVISIVDHHKNRLNTYTPAVTVVSDAQSTNTLVAELTMQINDNFSLSCMNREKIQALLKDGSISSKVYSRVLKKKEIISRNNDFYIHHQREFIEYLHFLFGILDDTDLLMKVTKKDVIVVAELLNRMKSIMIKKDTEIINFDDIELDDHFPKKAAERILKNKDMYSLYRKVYLYKEKEVNKNLLLASKNHTSNIFSDIKVQNACSAVSQTKMFLKNIKTFEKHVNVLRNSWVEMAKANYKERPEIDLHIHMISTIRGSEDVYSGKVEKYKHKDELWIWIPKAELAIEHLKSFLTSFSRSPHIIENMLYAQFFGSSAELFKQIFEESFVSLEKVTFKKDLPIAVLYYNAGTINSRKAMISPYLPSRTG
ncbi:MAG: hypothetical protein JXA94_02690 [Parachlamydiales bacterium]|nr:hypothetical protein [Parachlamydiales bacterium]